MNTTQTQVRSTEEALKLALEALEYYDKPLKEYSAKTARDKDFKAIAAIKEALAQPEPSPEWMTEEEQTAYTFGWFKALEQQRLAQPKEPEQEPVAWRYKPAREDNPRWEYTTNHPLDMGDGYIRPSLVEYCKCIEPLYAKEKPKLMLEKFREMEDLLEEPAQQEPATKEKIREAIVFNLPLYTTPPQRKSLTDEEIDRINLVCPPTQQGRTYRAFARAIEAAHGIKE